MIRSLATAFATLVLLAACASSRVPAPIQTKPMPAATQGFLAGVKLADITPPLHLSLFGHGPEGRVATGVRLRLRCEVFVIAAQDDLVALVPCDLAAPSMALQRRVAKKLHDYGVPLTADRVFLMATHTHAGPAHYFESRRYSGTFSSEAPGYDDDVVEFLANRIAGAVTEAFAALAPACVGWAYADVRDLSFNRAYVPFLSNQPVHAGDPQDPVMVARQAEQEMKSASAPSAAPAAPDATPANAVKLPTGTTGPEAAIDPQLSVLKINRRASAQMTCDGSTPLGVLAVFGVHPTGVPNTNQLYHGDIFGFAVRVAEGHLSRVNTTQADPLRDAWAAEAAPPGDAHVIVGLANGVEGDVSPRVLPQSVPAARRHGRLLGQKIAELAQGEVALQASGTLKHLYWDLHFPGGQFSAKHEDRLCAQPELGIASGGGAHDGPTRLRIIPEANAGYRPDEPHGCHRYKLPLRIGASSSKYDFPRVAPIALIQIGDGILATAPGEMTTMTGRRIRDGILSRLGPEPRRKVALVGLTNQYLQYFTTGEEYDFQFYEGASNLYGPNSEKFLVRHFSQLTDRLEGHAFDNYGQPKENQPEPLDADPDPEVARWPDEQAVPARDLDPLVAMPHSRDGSCGWDLEFARLPLRFTSDRQQFSVEIMERRNDTEVLVDDDRGAGIEVREIEKDRWRVRWVPDLSENDPRCGRVYSIAVRGTVQLESRPFKLTCESANARCEP